ncbi:MAG: hypothetical protein ABIH23_20275 [bacterium]
MSDIIVNQIASTAALDIIKDALENIRVSYPNQVLSSTEATNYLRTLNLMMDELSIDNLIVPALMFQSFPLTANKVEYTIGPNADFNATRPESIDARLCFVRDASNIDRPLLPMTAEEYRSIGLKSTGATYPGYLYYDPQFPIGRIYLSSPPIAGLDLYLASLNPFSAFPSITTEVVFPAGYKSFLSNYFTVWIATKHGKPVPPSCVAIAAKIRSTLEAKHSQPLRKNLGLPGTGGGMSRSSFESGGFR